MRDETGTNSGGVRELTPEDLKLIELFDELKKGSLGFLNEAAKKLVELVIALYGLFFAVFSFTEAPQYLKEYPDIKLLSAGILLAYFLALVFAVLVFLPRRYQFSSHSLTQMRSQLETMLETKGTYLRYAYASFALGTLFFAVALGITLFRL